MYIFFYIFSYLFNMRTGTLTYKKQGGIIKQISGELVKQAERKLSNFDP